MKVLKRNGLIVNFDDTKIFNAIAQANENVKNLYKDKKVLSDKAIDVVVDNVIGRINTDTISVEEIQNLVEEELVFSGYFFVAKEYIRYRYKRELGRNHYNELMDSIKEKLEGTNIQNQNANVDEQSFGGRVGEATDVVMKKFALDNCVSKMARDNHNNNMIYIHDLNSFAVGMHNCLTVPFDDLLANGFNTRQTDVRPANSVNTAFQLVAVLFQLQSLQQFGGVAASHLDWTMVPYVRKSFYKHYRDGIKYLEGREIDYSFHDGLSIEEEDYKACSEKAYEYAMDMTIKETQQAVEGMYHNLNTLQSRSGNQLPFTSINYGTCTLPEGRMVIKALLEGSIKGVGKFRKTSIFPCGIFQCMKGVNRGPGDPNYDLFQLALKSTATRLYPNYANVDWSGNAGYDRNDPTTYFATMGCRTANGWDINGLGQQKDGRGNICPVTIIMPTLAMMAREYWENYPSGDDSPVEGFMVLLNEKIHEAKDMLIERFEYICSQDASSAKFMYENNVMAGYVPEEGIRSALKHGTLALGQLGLAETLEILIGCNHTTEKGMELAKRIEQLFKDRCAEFKQEYKLNFGVYYTPAENLCYTAMNKFKDKYGIIPKVSDKDYFTNSIHVPVWEDVSIYEKINIESELTGYSSAGCITYVELESSAKNNLEALEKIVNYAMDKDIPYFAINVPNDMCMACGYTDDINVECPMCGGDEIQRLRRVTGYLTGNYTTAFNKGKQQEVEMRYKHSKKEIEWERI